MDITDVIGKGPDLPRPVHPDMDRVMEIVLQMKATSEENRDNPEAFMREWKALIEQSIDFDVLAYQAMQVALQIFKIHTGRDFRNLKQDSRKFNYFVSALQAFYDGFLLGAQFEKRGGHRD